MFENIEIYPYRRSGQDNKKQKSPKNSGSKRRFPLFRSRLAVTPEALALCLAGFFLGRAVLLGELLPFGAAFVVAAGLVFGRPGFLAVPAVVLGLATVSNGLPLAGSTLAVLCAWLLTRLVPPEVKRPWLIFPAVVLAVTVIIKTSLVAFTEPSAYRYFTVLFEAVFAALLTAVMIFGMAALKERAGGSRPFTGEEIFCILLLGGGVLAGTSDLRYEMVTVKGSLSRFAILLAAQVGGAGAGAAAGAVAGIIPGLAYTVAPAMVGAYSFAGLLAGACRSFSRVGVATGFLLGNIILSIYVAEYENVVAVLAETGIAIVLFMLFPAGQVERLRVSLGLETGGSKSDPAGEEMVKDMFQRKIKDWARVFRELSRTFEQVSSTAGQNREEQSLQKLLNQVGEKVCYDCSFYRTCWEREFYKTYQGLIDLLALMEIYGKISPDNLSDEVKRRCSRTKELAITISCLYETYNLSRYWFRRLLESREIVAEQLRGISEAMAALPGELYFEAEAGDTGPLLRKKLRDEGIQVETLSVHCREDGGVEVSLTHRPCGGKMSCRDMIGPLLSAELGRTLRPAATACTCKETEQSCLLRFYPEPEYRLGLGVAGMGKNGSLVSGDSHAFIHLRGGRFGLVLSDGMGAGPRAALESGTTISLLRQLLESGFGQDLAVKTVNSILILRSPGESFATVDLAVVNLYNGQAEFIKIGAAPSFLIHGEMVTRITASSLPVGIIREMEVVTLDGILEDGDILVLVTDGILDAYHGAGDREEWLVDILMDVADLPPRDMAEIILKLAQTGAGGASRAPDDMTVMVARLERQEEETVWKTAAI